MVERPYLSQQLRRLVINRAEKLCEYCLIHEDDTALGCAIDHIISLKHGGETNANNLAYACVFCNRYKGSDIGSIVWQTREFTRFYNPRYDHWGEHFKLEDKVIIPLTKIGEVTARIFLFNNDDRLLERQLLISRGKYPHSNAIKLMI